MPGSVDGWMHASIMLGAFECAYVVVCISMYVRMYALV